MRHTNLKAQVHFSEIPCINHSNLWDIVPGMRRFDMMPRSNCQKYCRPMSISPSAKGIYYWLNLLLSQKTFFNPFLLLIKYVCICYEMIYPISNPHPKKNYLVIIALMKSWKQCCGYESARTRLISADSDLLHKTNPGRKKLWDIHIKSTKNTGISNIYILNNSLFLYNTHYF